MTLDRSDPLDRLCSALADPTRRRIVERLRDRPGSTTGEIAAMAPGMTRFGVMKHLAVLRDAGLIQTLPAGRRRHHYGVERALEPLREWLAPASRSVGER